MKVPIKNDGNNNTTENEITLKHLLAKLVAREPLNDAEATFAIRQIASEESAKNPVGVGVLLALLAAKGETASEVAAFAKYMRAQSIRVHVESERPTLDIVGTGGDGANTVNLSTAAAVLAASCGALVAKHGNRSVSSRSGSADVLEELGVPMLLPHAIAPCIAQTNIAFMYAPHFHPAMRFVSPIRKSISIRSVFNVLGPLLNPAGCKRIVIGVYTPDLLQVFGEVYVSLGVEHGLVVHCAGLDEFNAIGAADVVEVKIGEPLRRYTIAPEEIGIPRTTLLDLKGGDATENAAILRRVFSGGDASDNAIGNTIAYNAGAGLYVYGLADSIKSGYEMAKTKLASGEALKTLDKWAETAQALHAASENGNGHVNGNGTSTILIRVVDGEYAYAQQLVASYFHMLRVGCQQKPCVNPQYRSSASAAMLAAPSSADAAIQSVYLARTSPIPICAPILARFGLMEHNKQDESGQEECPETEDDNNGQDVTSGSDTGALLCSTARRRLSSAVELALTFTNRSNSQERHGKDDAEEDRCEQQQKLSRTRKLSLPKQKLLDALTRAFDRTSSPTSTAKSSSRCRKS
ncbi:Anthranilate phosphoribosyltransferase, partial [Globisporangium splendens]